MWWPYILVFLGALLFDIVPFPFPFGIWDGSSMEVELFHIQKGHHKDFHKKR